ncbi:hypothetical protein [Dehalogenimonas sp. 4OHTPN]|uniref:Uncharacterized protein n=1 Tax=Dehalogenimonas sp. 4OHTPN TaxID=3166643 RepID=A0AAU8GEE6_9CHLR
MRQAIGTNRYIDVSIVCRRISDLVGVPRRGMDTGRIDQHRQEQHDQGDREYEK